MSDKRTLEVIHREYSQMCSQAGHLGYQIVTLQKDLDLLHTQLRELNFEAAKLQADEKAAPAEAVKPSESESV